MNIYLLAYLLLIVAPIGMVIHESGHLIGAKIVKADHIILSIGMGNKIFSFSIKNVQINVHIYFFVGGYVKNKRTMPYKRSEMITIISLGPILNGIFAVVFYYLYHATLSKYIYLLFLFNLWLAFVNVIPLKVKRKQSDGYMILNLLQKNKL